MSPRSAPVRAEIVGSALTRELRRSVLRPHQRPDEPLPGDDVDDAVHLAVLADDGSPLSACFLFVEQYSWLEDGRSESAVGGQAVPPTDRTLWHLRSVATVPGRQRSGLGSALMTAVFEHVASHGGGVLWCNARTPAVPFYERFAMRTFGREHVSGGLDHYYMWRVVDPVRGQP